MAQLNTAKPQAGRICPEKIATRLRLSAFQGEIASVALAGQLNADHRALQLQFGAREILIIPLPL